jgi:hypothetical protein
MKNRFTDRAVTLQEKVWLYKAGKGDVEAMAELMKSRRVDPSFDVMSLAGAELDAAVKEMGDAIVVAVNEEKEWAEMLAGSGKKGR